VHGLYCRENTNKTKSLFIFSLALGTSNHVTVDVMCNYSYNMGDKIRSIRMNVAFEYIYQKEWSYLTMEGFSTFTKCIQLYMIMTIVDGR
jgi:hypothetical protein